MSNTSSVANNFFLMEQNLSTNSTTEENSIRGFSDRFLVIVWVLFSIIWIFGFIANTGVVKIIHSTKLIPLNVFILGLCCSDMVSAICSPVILLSLVTTDRDYPFPNMICKIANAIHSVASAVTVELVLVLSVWRLIALARPQKAATIMTVKKAKYLVTCIWLISSILLTPGPLTLLNVVKPPETRHTVCLCKPEDLAALLIYVVVVETALVNIIPISAIIIISIAIGFFLVRQRRMSQQVSSSSDCRRENRALTQIALIVTAFLIGYIPRIAYFIRQYVQPMDFMTHKILYITSLGVRNLTESINPILYFAGSFHFREYLKECLGYFFRLFKSEDPPSVSETNNTPVTHKSKAVECKTSEAPERFSNLFRNADPPRSKCSETSYGDGTQATQDKTDEMSERCSKLFKNEDEQFEISCDCRSTPVTKTLYNEVSI